jgi:hypothetical protein
MVKKEGSVAESVGKRAVEKAAPWKSPKAGLSHSAWKSNNGPDFHFSYRPGYHGSFPNFIGEKE